MTGKRRPDTLTIFGHIQSVTICRLAIHSWVQLPTGDGHLRPVPTWIGLAPYAMGQSVART